LNQVGNKGNDNGWANMFKCRFCALADDGVAVFGVSDGSGGSWIVGSWLLGGGGGGGGGGSGANLGWGFQSHNGAKCKTRSLLVRAQIRDRDLQKTCESRAVDWVSLSTFFLLGLPGKGGAQRLTKQAEAEAEEKKRRRRTGCLWLVAVAGWNRETGWGIGRGAEEGRDQRSLHHDPFSA